MRKLLLAGLLAFTATPARSGAWKTPADTTGMVLMVDTGWFGNDGQYFLTAVENQQYETDGNKYVQDSPTDTPNIRFEEVIADFATAKGGIHISGDGGPDPGDNDGFMIVAFATQTRADSARSCLLGLGYAADELAVVEYGDHYAVRGYGLFLTATGLRNRFKPTNNPGPTVMLNVCYGGVRCAGIMQGNGASHVLSNPREIFTGDINQPGSAMFNAYHYWRRLDGQEGGGLRASGSAAEDLFDLSASPPYEPLVQKGDKNMTLAPYVTYCSVPTTNFTVSMGTTPVTVQFSTNMEADPEPGWFTIVPNPGDVEVRITSRSGQQLDFTVHGLRGGDFALSITPRSADAMHLLDGNQSPWNSNGVGPSGDAFVIKGYSTYNDPNWASAFSSAGAFPDIDGTHVYCVTSFEAGTESLAVYAGRDRERLLAVTPAAGSSERPWYYEWVVPSGETTFEIVEVDDDPSFDYTTRLFSLDAAAPRDLDSLRAINALSGPRQPPGLLSVRCEQGLCAEPPPAPEPIDVVFASTRADFLASCELVKDVYRGWGWTVKDTVVTRDAFVLRSYFWSVVLANAGANRPRPVLYLVGTASQDSVYDFAPTFWFQDPTGQMWPSTVPNDGFYSAFGPDSLPQAPVLRIPAVTAAEVANAAYSGWSNYTLHANAPQDVMLLNGNTSGCGNVMSEPTATFLRYWDRLPGTVEMLSDSSFACDDYTNRLYALSSRFIQCWPPNVNEVIGTGWITTQGVYPGSFCQQAGTPRFGLGYLFTFCTPGRFTAVLPGCSLADFDEWPWSGHIGRLLLTGEPLQHATATAIIGPSRPNVQTYHLRMLDLYLGNRTSGRYASIQDAYLDAERQLVVEQPGAKWYVWSTVMAGWLTSYPDMLPLTAVGRQNTRVTISLAPPAPNPSRGHASITFSLDAERDVRLTVYDVAGRQVRVLTDGHHPAGTNTFTWDGRTTRERPVSNGIYFLRLDAGNTHINRKVTILR